MSRKKIFNQLRKLSTEQRNPASMNIDARSVTGILSIMNKEDATVAGAVRKEIRFIAKAVELVVSALQKGGRLLYVGAGTSGRLGVLDAVECPPTFGTDPDTIRGMIAGGDMAMFRAQEGAEDREENGATDIRSLNIRGEDVVCGIAASLRTPYVLGAVKAAKAAGARTVFLTTNKRKTLYSQEFGNISRFVDVGICVDVGPEVIMGSTRMKSGTAQKMVLNMITTAAMIRLGKVYENMMVDLQLTNDKLRERARRILMIATGLDYDAAGQILEEAGGHVKTALVMAGAGVSREEAARRLTQAGGFVRPAMAKKGARK